jgi:hypothetical protein
LRAPAPLKYPLDVNDKPPRWTQGAPAHVVECGSFAKLCYRFFSLQLARASLRALRCGVEAVAIYATVFGLRSREGSKLPLERLTAAQSGSKTPQSKTPGYARNRYFPAMVGPLPLGA